MTTDKERNIFTYLHKKQLNVFDHVFEVRLAFNSTRISEQEKKEKGYYWAENRVYFLGLEGEFGKAKQVVKDSYPNPLRSRRWHSYPKEAKYYANS